MSSEVKLFAAKVSPSFSTDELPMPSGTYLIYQSVSLSSNLIHLHNAAQTSNHNSRSPLPRLHPPQHYQTTLHSSMSTTSHPRTAQSTTPTMLFLNTHSVSQNSRPRTPHRKMGRRNHLPPNLPRRLGNKRNRTATLHPLRRPKPHRSQNPPSSPSGR